MTYHEIAIGTNAGLTNDGPNRRAGKCRTWKMMELGIKGGK